MNLGKGRFLYLQNWLPGIGSILYWVASGSVTPYGGGQEPRFWHTPHCASEYRGLSIARVVKNCYELHNPWNTPTRYGSPLPLRNGIRYAINK